MSDVHNAQDVDTSVQTPPVDDTRTIQDRGSDGPGSGRTPLRRQLEDSAAEVRKRDDGGRFTGERERKPTVQKSRARQDQEQLDQEPIEGELEEPEAAPDPNDVAPKAFSKEAQAEWANTPPNVRAAILKRETDIARGVLELKQKYSDVEQAIAPRVDMIRAHGHTPAQAINQLFSWFEALSADVQRVRSGQPPVAWNALLNSFGLTPAIFGQAQPAQKPAAEAPTEADQGEIPPALQTYIQQLEQKLDGFQRGVYGQYQELASNYQADSQRRTQEVLDHWSKDKPHFEEVRSLMAYLIGSGAVQPLPNGAADLDTAYDMALYANPQVRAQVLAEQRKAAAEERKRKIEAERKAQQEQADKARRAGGSLSSSAPGAEIPGQSKKSGVKSVRDSLKEAIQEVTER